MPRSPRNVSADVTDVLLRQGIEQAEVVAELLLLLAAELDALRSS